MQIEPWVPVFYEAPGFGLQEYITIAVGIGAALLGALVGGWISWRQAEADRKAQDERDRSHRIEKEKALLIRAQFQVSLILSDVSATIKAMNQSLEAANTMGLTFQPLFMRMTPIIGNMETPATDIEAIAPLIAARENGLVRAYFETHAKHGVLNKLLRRFDDEKTDLNDRVSPFLTLQEGRTQLEMTPERKAKLQPYFEAADSLAQAIRTTAQDVKAAATVATFGIGAAAKRIYNDESFPALVPTNMSDETPTNSP